uniref:Uncharacterized protein n=1 Tax=Siphoviridae sp. ctwHj1 TaxID=2825727 RepID=A0A8S5U672_9CAUD|nr:MAG TPA: hypothetical protein [Siphoviridae sp. ctwHj1]
MDMKNKHPALGASSESEPSDIQCSLYAKRFSSVPWSKE